MNNHRVSEALRTREPAPRFWIEAFLASVTAILALVTLVWRDWIELVFRVDPDHRNGLTEYMIVAALLVGTIISAGFARTEWRRTPTRPQQQ